MLRILNETSINIFIRGEKISPGNFRDFDEKDFDRTEVHCAVGTVRISTKYNLRFFESLGLITALERACNTEEKEVIVKFKF